MKEVYFKPDGGALRAKAIFPQSTIAPVNYEIILREAGSNNTISLLQGDNLNPEDDVASLPFTPDLLHGRRVILDATYVGLNPVQSPGYRIRLEIWQDKACLGFVEETGVLTGKGQYTILFIRLLAS
ncbi:hypothetical protein SAMN05444266_110171 [Chitinophaga jiangningensis]|uniref:Uncharacterized protein n=1 Tax=Chitinophaga jiangningensis TaxID=1419482 RepID=A0A1M7L787_9BACT|nr:hypothetical protein [Chitinophaga jiangningensis]SHM73776.1 hypothetical protein SAMN05444266_110171 [Chitinophaga jiangningensis]